MLITWIHGLNKMLLTSISSISFCFYEVTTKQFKIRYVAHIIFLLDSIVIKEETEGQRGKTTSRRSQSNREAEPGPPSGFQTGTPDPLHCSTKLHR